MAINDRALAGLQRLIDNGEPPQGGALLTMSYDPDAGTYYAGFSAGECGGGVEGPALLPVLLGVGMLDEGEHVTLDAEGYADRDGSSGWETVLDLVEDAYPDWAIVAVAAFDEDDGDIGSALEAWAIPRLLDMGLMYHPEPCSTMLTDHGEHVARRDLEIEPMPDASITAAMRLLALVNGTPGSHVHLDAARGVMRDWPEISATIDRGIAATKSPGANVAAVAQHWAREAIVRLAAIG